MKPRKATQTSLPVPREALLNFTDPSRWPPGGPGEDFYPDRDAWLAARHDWEARDGVTVPEWSERTHAELVAQAGSLGELDEALDLTMYEPDEWAGRYADPRLVTS